MVNIGEQNKAAQHTATMLSCIVEFSNIGQTMLQDSFMKLAHLDEQLTQIGDNTRKGPKRIPSGTTIKKHAWGSDSPSMSRQADNQNSPEASLLSDAR